MGKCLQRLWRVLSVGAVSVGHGGVAPARGGMRCLAMAGIWHVVPMRHDQRTASGATGVAATLELDVFLGRDARELAGAALGSGGSRLRQYA